MLRCSSALDTRLAGRGALNDFPGLRWREEVLRGTVAGRLAAGVGIGVLVEALKVGAGVSATSALGVLMDGALNWNGVPEWDWLAVVG